MAEIFWILSKVNWFNLLDILLVGTVIYGVLWLVRGTQAVQLLRGVIVLALVIALVGQVAGFTAFNWLLATAAQALMVVAAVVLQPELRRALDRLGRAGPFGIFSSHEVELDRVIREIASCAQRLSERRHGALIVIERETGLQDHIDTGTAIDSLVNNELMQTIFFPNTALHDGAVIIRADRIAAAGCVLPLASTLTTDSHLGTRHRAAVGITEQTDAVTIVVSEETGIISMARNGRIVRHLDERRLVPLLQALLRTKRETGKKAGWLARRKQKTKPSKES